MKNGFVSGCYGDVPDAHCWVGIVEASISSNENQVAPSKVLTNYFSTFFSLLYRETGKPYTFLSIEPLGKA